MSLDFTPSGKGAPSGSRVWSHARTEAGLIARNGEQLLLALVIPVGMLIGGRLLSEHLGLEFDELVVSVVGLALWSTTFTTLAIATGFERRYQVLERLAATPLGKSGLLAGKALGIFMLGLIQVAVLLTIGYALGWRPEFDLAHLLVAALACLLAGICFAGLALTMAGTLRAELTLALSNLVYLTGAALGALLIPIADHPAWAHPILWATPTGALGEALRAGTGWALLTLTLWAAGSLLIARKAFRWTS